MRRRIKIIGNPISGRGRSRHLAEDVTAQLRGLGCEVELAYTAKAGDARGFAGEVAGFDAVGVVGGDGTVNEVASGLPEGAPPVCHIPCGTANVLAKEIGLPRDPASLAAVLAEGREIPWDLAVDRVHGRRFLLMASAGYDASVVHLFHAKRTGPIHMWQYLWWGVKSIFESPIPRIAVALDGRELTREAAWVIVSNVSQYGGPLVFTPRARPDDGRLEVLVLHDRGHRDTVRMFWRAIVGWALGVDLRLGGVTFHQARRVALASTGGAGVPLQIDGDPAGHLPVELEVRPGAVRMLGPRAEGGSNPSRDIGKRATLMPRP